MEINATVSPLTLINEDNKTFLRFLHNMTIPVDPGKTEKLIISLSLSVIILIGSLGNPIMIVCICRIWSSNRIMCRHLLHLTIVDLIRVFFCLPIRLATYYDHISYSSGTLMLFQTKMFMDIFTEILQLQILLLISRDRYYAVAKPFEKHSDQSLKSICILICSWSCGFSAAGFASYFYEDYLRLLSTCEGEMQLFVFMILFLIYESAIVSGIIQFYLRTIYFLLKQGEKMRSLRQTVHPFVPHSEIKDASDSTRNKVRPEFITNEKQKMVDHAVVSNIIESTVPDFKYPETKTAQNEIQNEIKTNPNVAKGLSDSTGVMPTSANLVLPNVAEDINERMTRLQLQKEMPENFSAHPNCREKKDTQPQIPADATEFLENSQKDNRTKRLDIVINCTFNGIAAQTKIVDDQNSSIIKPKRQLPSFSRANEIVDTKVKTVANPKTVGRSMETKKSCSGSQISSGNDQSEIPAEKIFVISQQVAFTVKSVQTLSVGLKEDANIQSSCCASKDKIESSIQLEKGFDDEEECSKKDTRPNVKIEIPGQIKIDDETANKNKSIFKENINGKELDTHVKLTDNNSSLPTKGEASSENEATGTFQMSRKETIIDAAGPFCPMPKRSKLKQRFHKEVRITQRITVLIIFLILCWIPLYAFRFKHILFLHSKRCSFHQQYQFLWWETLSASTSAINPCLYGILNVQLKREFFHLIRHFRNYLTNFHCCR